MTLSIFVRLKYLSARYMGSCRACCRALAGLAAGLLSGCCPDPGWGPPGVCAATKGSRGYPAAPFSLALAHHQHHQQRPQPQVGTGAARSSPWGAAPAAGAPGAAMGVGLLWLRAPFRWYLGGLRPWSFHTHEELIGFLTGQRRPSAGPESGGPRRGRVVWSDGGRMRRRT